MILSEAQELKIWELLVTENKSAAAMLTGPRRQLAHLAFEAHRLLCSYAPHALEPRKRNGWQRDAEAMSNWLISFEQRCMRERLLSASRLPLELLNVITRGEHEAQGPARAALKLVGFDRLQPAQLSLLEAWGEWELVSHSETALRVEYYSAPDLMVELAACVRWCGQMLKANPKTRLMVVTNEASERRGEIERAFTRWLGIEAQPAIEFSLGLTMSRIPLIHAAELLLRWIDHPLAENELDWLLSSGFLSISANESAALLWFMRILRRRKKEQPEWSFDDFLRRVEEESVRGAQADVEAALSDFARRMHTTRRVLRDAAGGANLTSRKTLLEWVELAPKILNASGWPGFRTLESAEAQARLRLDQHMEALAELGFDGRRVQWSDFTVLLSQVLAEALFAPESREAPILIAGPAESAGLTADGIWFLGAHDQGWPISGTTNPMLPLGLQREAGMPHATTEMDWEFADTMTKRFLHSAADVRFSFARLCGDEEMKPSRLLERSVGAARELSEDLLLPPGGNPFTELVVEKREIPFLLPKVRGGANLLTLQSNCPFKAFATERLGAERWSAAEYGFTASQRGQLLHQLMREIWSGAQQGGLKGSADLRALLESCTSEVEDEKNLEEFVQNHAHRVLNREIDPELRARLVPEYIELELERLTHLVSEWLRYEAKREAFEVVALEDNRSVNLAGLALELRIDRIDRLNDGSLLVIDYKSGDVKTNLWEVPRPEDVQLPLYACFALNRDAKDGNEPEVAGGLAFAKISAKYQSFAGHLRDAEKTIFAGLSNQSALKKLPLTDEMLFDWKKEIQGLAESFVRGDAEVDPRIPLKTCEKCEYKVLCRVRESEEIFDEDAEDEEIEVDSE
jgi:probable DNA repair protein